MKIWVVEMWFDAAHRWEPTVGVGLTRKEGRRALAWWRIRNTVDKFRLRPYGPKDAR